MRQVLDLRFSLLEPIAIVGSQELVEHAPDRALGVNVVSESVEEVEVLCDGFPGQVGGEGLYLADEPLGKFYISGSGSVELQVVEQALDLTIGNRPVVLLHLVIGPPHVVVEGIHK